jgi:ribosome-associated heat shock protein Hsp15
MTRVRLDKWLWAARFFKTRSMAADACELGRVHAGGQKVKPAREVHVGDLLEVKTPGGVFVVEVLGLSDVRGPAPVAQTLYLETEESKESRRRAAEERKAMPHFDVVSGGRPSKRDRRVMGRLRGRM